MRYAPLPRQAVTTLTHPDPVSSHRASLRQAGLQDEEGAARRQEVIDFTRSAPPPPPHLCLALAARDCHLPSSSSHPSSASAVSDCSAALHLTCLPLLRTCPTLSPSSHFIYSPAPPPPSFQLVSWLYQYLPVVTVHSLPFLLLVFPLTHTSYTLPLGWNCRIPYIHTPSLSAT